MHRLFLHQKKTQKNTLEGPEPEPELVFRKTSVFEHHTAKEDLKISDVKEGKRGSGKK